MIERSKAALSQCAGKGYFQEPGTPPRPLIQHTAAAAAPAPAPVTSGPSATFELPVEARKPLFLQGTPGEAREALAVGTAKPSTFGWTGGKRAFQLPRRWLTESSLESLAAAALKRQAAGSEAIPYVLENATHGVGARDDGRAFGVELEFDLLPEKDPVIARRKIGNSLFDFGLTCTPEQTFAHKFPPIASHEGGWRFERDCTVEDGGEVVSPIMYDERETWENLRNVLGVLVINGGHVTTEAGGHIHVGTGDFGEDVAPYQAILDLFHRYKPELYTLATNPGEGMHRYLQGNDWCEPNRMLETDGSLEDFRNKQRGKDWAINFRSIDQGVRSHVEYRLWDGSLDPGVVQTRIDLSVAMTEYAKNPTVGPHTEPPAPGKGVGKPDLARLARLLEEIFPDADARKRAATLFGLVVEASKR